jgi:hypothetical protein
MRVVQWCDSVLRVHVSAIGQNEVRLRGETAVRVITSGLNKI